MKKIGGLFGRPAYGPIYEHMLKVMDCLKVLDSLIQSFIEGNYPKIESLMEETCKLEHDADIIKKGIRESFTKSIFGSTWLRGNSPRKSHLRLAAAGPPNPVSSWSRVQ